MDSKREKIDYRAAGSRLIVALASIAQKMPGHEVSARRICSHVFGDLANPWQIETKRRRVRDAADAARQILRERYSSLELLGNGAGYWLTGDPAMIRYYANQRKRRGLRDLQAASRGMRSPAMQLASGQASLFPSPAPMFRH